jgi:hypothetical protein
MYATEVYLLKLGRTKAEGKETSHIATSRKHDSIEDSQGKRNRHENGVQEPLSILLDK